MERPPETRSATPKTVTPSTILALHDGTWKRGEELECIKDLAVRMASRYDAIRDRRENFDSEELDGFRDLLDLVRISTREGFDQLDAFLVDRTRYHEGEANRAGLAYLAGGMSDDGRLAAHLVAKAHATTYGIVRDALYELANGRVVAGAVETLVEHLDQVPAQNAAAQKAADMLSDRLEGERQQRESAQRYNGSLRAQLSELGGKLNAFAEEMQVQGATAQGIDPAALFTRLVELANATVPK